MTTTTIKLVFDHITCSRCMGGGRYSYCQTMQGKYGPETCFKCRGAGVTLTKKGAAASALLQRAYSKPAEELQPGDQILNRSYGRSKWETVERAYQQTADDHTGFSVTDTGPRYYFCVRTDKTSNLILDRRELFRVAQTAERKAEIMPLVAEYQNLLTKAGKPRKAHVARVDAILDALGVPAPE